MTQDIITLIINNIEYSGWLSVNIAKSLENLSASFSIDLTQLFDNDNSINQVVKRGDEIKVLIDGRQIINGFIDTVSISYSNNSHSIRIDGFDKTIDLVQSSLVGNQDLNPPYTVVTLVNSILRGLNLSNKIKVTNTVSGLSSYDVTFDSERGKNAWQALDKYLQKKSVFATSDTDGNIVIFRGSFGSTARGLFNRKTNNTFENNVLSATKNTTTANRFNLVSVVSQSESIESEGLFYDQGGESFVSRDNSIRNSRKTEVLANSSMTSEECQELASFIRNINQARGTVYTYRVQGFKQSENGDLWLPNYLVHVTDDFFDLDADLLIRSVSFSKSTAGSFTTMELVDKYAYSLREPQGSIEEEEEFF